MYGAAFVMRPLGGLLLGYIGDKYGRTIALQLSVVGMGLAALTLAALPSYDYGAYKAGLASTVLMIVIRMIQGLSVGGELVGSMIYSVESAPADQVTLLGAIPLASALGGMALGFLVAGIIGTILSEEQMYLYGWRIGFGLGVPLIVFAVVCRRYMHESPVFLEMKKKREAGAVKKELAPLREVFSRDHLPAVLVVFLVTGLWCLGIWLTQAWVRIYYTYELEGTHVTETAGYYINTGVVVVGALSFVPIALLADRLEDGRFKVMLAGAVYLAALAPVLLFLIDHGTYPAVVAGQLLLMLGMAIFGAPMTTWMVGKFPTATQYTGLALAYNLSQAVYAGPALLVATGLLDATGNIWGVGCYWAAVAAVAGCALVVGERTSLLPRSSLYVEIGDGFGE